VKRPTTSNTNPHEAVSRPVQCHRLPAFPADDLVAIRRAFRQATPLPLRQMWLSKPDPHFAPAAVRAGWRGSSLLVFAELTDADVFTLAKLPNERLWELGDSFEIFLRPVEQQAYVEFQVAPNNQRLQLRFASPAAVEHARKTGSLDGALMRHDAFTSRTWVRPKTGRWFAFVKIPAKSVGESAGPLPGSKWFFSFSRYDHTRGRNQPVISSTSPHTKPDFHRQREWGTMRFQK
jgi:hypothetical protein